MQKKYTKHIGLSSVISNLNYFIYMMKKEVTMWLLDFCLKKKEKEMQSTLGKMREWIQWNAINGSSVTWGSDEILRFSKNQSVRFFEGLASELSQDATIDDFIKKQEQQKVLIDILEMKLKFRATLFDTIHVYANENSAGDLKTIYDIIKDFKTDSKGKE